MATDIAFALGIYSFFKDRMPPGALTFLLTLATVDDLGATLHSTLYTHNLHPASYTLHPAPCTLHAALS
jgi:Na+/H+ antiporter NhaA